LKIWPVFKTRVIIPFLSIATIVVIWIRLRFLILITILGY